MDDSTVFCDHLHGDLTCRKCSSYNLSISVSHVWEHVIPSPGERQRITVQGQPRPLCETLFQSKEEERSGT